MGFSPRISVPIALLVLFLLLSSCVTASDNRISCFIIGIVNPSHNPFAVYFDKDPIFRYSVEPVPPYLPIEDKQKLDRLYYPRTREDLIEGYEFMVFADPWIDHFTRRQIHDLDYVFREAGMSGFSSFGQSFQLVWEATILYELWPVSDYINIHNIPYRTVFSREREPIFMPFVELGIENIPGNTYHEMTPKTGSTIWAEMRPNGLPWLVSWRPGGTNAGTIWVVPGAFDPTWWGVGRWMNPEATRQGTDINPYAIDFATNLILYSLDRELIADIFSRRETRRLIYSFRTQKLLVLSMMEWADNFGANTLALSARLTELELRAEDAIDFYLEQDYPGATAIMQTMSSDIASLTADAVDLKDQALFWVYLSEWLVVTSVSIIAGFILWTLMIRRRMYRGVQATRLQAS
jgi:hypothetical protein